MTFVSTNILHSGKGFFDQIWLSYLLNLLCLLAIITHNFYTDIAHWSIMAMDIYKHLLRERTDEGTERHRDIVIARAALQLKERETKQGKEKEKGEREDKE